MADLADFLVGRVVDADTVDTVGGSRVRLEGVNAPELDTAEGQEAAGLAEYLIDKHGGEVETTGERGYYGRELGDVRLGTGVSLSEFLVESGQARQTDADNPDLTAAEGRGVQSRVLGFAPDSNLNAQIDFSGQDAARLGSPNGVFLRGMERGTDTLQQLIYSAGNVGAQAIGDMIGTDVLDNWGVEGLKQNLVEAAMNPAQIESWDDVDSLATFGTYVIEALGEQIPNLASLVGTGGAGSLIARAAVGKKLALNALKHSNAMHAARIQLAGQRGMQAGVFGGSYTMGVGEIGQELREAGIDSPGTALLGGVPFALLDTVGFQATIGRLFRGIDPTLATQSVKDIGKSIFKAAGVGAGAESSTEMLQEVITLSARAFHDPEFEIFSDENLARIREAGIKAGIVGGVAGGATTGVQTAYMRATELSAKDRAALEKVLRDQKDLTEGFIGEGEQLDMFGGGGTAPSPATQLTEQESFDFSEQLELDFGTIDNDYGYIPDEASTPAASVFDEVPPGAEDAQLPIKRVLDEVLDPQIDLSQRRVSVHAALLECLSR